MKKSYLKSKRISIIIAAVFFILSVVLAIIINNHYTLYCLVISIIWLLLSLFDFNYQLISEQKREIEEITHKLEALEASMKVLSYRQNYTQNRDYEDLNKKRKINS